MTITELKCDKCGKSKRIESDIEKFIKDEVKKWEKKHRECGKIK